MSPRRSLLLSAFSAALLVVAVAASYIRLELARPEPFADRAVSALRSDDVRAAIARQLAVGLVERGSPDLVASRPLVLTAVEAVLETEAFEPVLRRGALAAHAVLLEGDSDVIVELEDAGDVLRPAIAKAAPGVARQIPAGLSPAVAQIERTEAASLAVRIADGAGPAALGFGGLAFVGFAFAAGSARDRRRALTGAGLMLALAAGAGFVGLAAIREQALPHAPAVGALSEAQARAAAADVWDALAGGLEDWLAVCGLAGLAVAGGAALSGTRLDRAGALRRGVETLAGGHLSRGARAARGLAVAFAGALVLLRAEPVFAVVVALTGGVLVLVGIADAAAAAQGGDGGNGRGRRRTRGRRRALVLAGGALAAAAVVVALAIRDGGGPPEPPAPGELVACNGSAALCDRPLGEVVLAGTHNSMSAADRPGWFFANQTRPIPAQLSDGIRLLMIDPHYGVVDSQGRVRTDLAAEGTTRNRVARELGADAVAAAEQLAGGIGLVPRDGDRRVFLCHSLCELGAEPMRDALEDVRGFLERERAEVVVIYVESSVEPDEVQSEFEDAGLLPYVATLPRGGALPALREMIESGRRLVVLDEDDGGDAPWYQPAFSFARDTRIASLDGCELGRGTPEAPLLLMNNWVDRFPPSPASNARAAGLADLLSRARRCRSEHGRLPSAVIVDFYERTGVIEAVRRLNALSP